MRLIDADVLTERLKNAIECGRRVDMPTLELEAVLVDVQNAPSIDIEPKRGEWIDYSCGSGCYCSNCGWDGDDIIDECIIQDFDFCPNCGARMKGADDDSI